MKKTLIIITIIISILSLNKQPTIPDDAIRFRVIANTSNEEDQLIKQKVVKNLSKELKKMNDISTKQEASNYINNSLPVFNNIVEKTLEENNSDKTFHINYGKNYFPEKEYNNETYPEGEYESLVVTLGEGKGKNFWCVLFPPLCFMDDEDVEYKSFFKELIDKYF